MNDILLIIIILIQPLGALTGVFMGFWIAWRCLKKEAVFDKPTEKVPEPEELEEPDETEDEEPDFDEIR